MQESGEVEAAAAFEGGFGGPGPEDWANGAAALAAALAREARVLAQAAAGLRAACAAAPGDPSGGPVSDVRRQRAALAAAENEARAGRIAAAARRAGVAPAAVAPLLRAAALDFRSDDAAARIAATAIAQEIAARLDQG
jgi:hypothetical protein